MAAQDPYAQFGPPVAAPAPPAQVDPYASFGPPVAPPAGIAPPPGTPSLASAPGAPPKLGTLPQQPQLLGDEGLLQQESRADKSYNQATSVLQQLKDAAKAPAMGAAVAAPIFTGGASLPIQSIISGASGAAQTKLMGGSNKDAAISGAVGAAVPPAIEGLGSLYSAAKNALAPAVEEAKSALNISPNTAGEGARVTPNNLVSEAYSPQANQVAASLRSNSRIDVPAEAHKALPALKEALSDMTDQGNPSEAFSGRNGPATFQKTVDHAIDIQEARAKAVIDPIREMQVDPQVLTQNPELASRFTPDQLEKGVTYGDIDNERIAMNKQLRRANFYSQDLSKQYAAGDPLANIEDAVNQARDAVYDQAYKTTGVDLRPLKQQESALIKLGDLAETTKNTLSEQTAKQDSATAMQKIMGGVKRAIAIKANPTNAFEPGFTDPTADFNRNMSRAFSDVKPAPGSIMKNGRLIEPGPGVLTHPNGTTPPEPDRQIPLSLDPLDKSVPRSLGAAASDTNAQDIPDKLRGMLTEMNDPQLANATRAQAGRAAELPGKYPAQALSSTQDPFAAPKLQSNGEIAWPDSYKNPPKGGGGNYAASDLDLLKKRMGIDTAPQGGHAGGGVASEEELSRPGKNYIVKSDGKLTYHGKSYAPEETPQGAAHVTVLPNGEFRVNAGDLTPAMRKALERGIKP